MQLLGDNLLTTSCPATCSGQTNIYIILLGIIFLFSSLIFLFLFISLKNKVSSILKFILLTLTVILLISSCFYTLEIIPYDGSCGSGCNESGTFLKGFKWHPLDITPIQEINYKISEKY